ncbi:hypothetical protein MKW94_013468 [Papaver nudicaule]|uniref:Cysteine-rich transmembrane CYSTM domain-containing protein n=1 Tax=Papaver nudicaule TaxID=74823 RepID=A0AA41V717_PAPNU|nr:hypothetical protein [Papaver nudicaule]
MAQAQVGLPQSYPPPAPAAGAYVAPPPVGYPGAEYAGQQPPQAPGATTNRSGQGFWEGCLSSFCCCCG